MSPRAVRSIVFVVCAAGIAGMIVSSIADNNGAAITFGLIAAVAALCLILVTAVSGPDAFTRRSGPPRGPEAEALAAEIEERIQELAEGGVREEDLRALVRDAVRLGRGLPRADGPSGPSG